MAVASGLVLLKPEERNPLKTSTYGTGLIIKNAIARGAERIILGLGGSATNDGGIGILAALGFQFQNTNEDLLDPQGKNLIAIQRIISPATLTKTKFIIACDVQNVLYGPQGAAHVYAPQKGADAGMIHLLDDGLKHFADVIKEKTGKDISQIPGTGAAGGIAAGLISFFEVELKKGVDLIIEASGIKNKMSNSDLVITGEGKIDKQTLEGKVVSEIASLAFENKIPVIAFCGISEADNSIIKQLHLRYVESLIGTSITKEEAVIHGRDLLTTKASQFFKKHFDR
jgi:glycerate kinase